VVDGFVRLTVAGPRRIFTGLPEHLPKEGVPTRLFLIVVRREEFVKEKTPIMFFEFLREWSIIQGTIYIELEGLQ
jgi:hypothetical protein